MQTYETTYRIIIYIDGYTVYRHAHTIKQALYVVQTYRQRHVLLGYRIVNTADETTVRLVYS